MPAHRPRVPPGQRQLLVVDALVDDAGPRVVRVGGVEVRQVRAGRRKVSRPVLVEPVGAGEGVGDAEPGDRRQVGRHRMGPVVPQGLRLGQQPALLVEAADGELRLGLGGGLLGLLGPECSGLMGTDQRWPLGVASTRMEVLACPQG